MSTAEGENLSKKRPGLENVLLARLKDGSPGIRKRAFDALLSMRPDHFHVGSRIPPDSEVIFLVRGMDDREASELFRLATSGTADSTHASSAYPTREGQMRRGGKRGMRSKPVGDRAHKRLKRMAKRDMIDPVTPKDDL